MTTGNKGRFSERLKKIVSFRKKKNVESPSVKIEDNTKIYTNFLKVVAAIPGLVYGNVTFPDVNEKKDSSKEPNEEIKVEATITDVRKIDLKRAENKKKINAIDIDSIKEKQANFPKKEEVLSKGQEEIKEPIKNVNIPQEKPVLDDNVSRIKALEKSIINLIKKDLIKIVNDMEILQSELYILSEVNGESKELKKCQEELDNVKSILCKIDKLKAQYDFLKDNYDFEYLLEINNNDLVDKIIELKDAFGNNELKAVAEDYKLLEVYKFLYLKLDDLQEKTAVFEEKKNAEVLKLKERDIDFEKLKSDVYSIDNTNRNYERFVRSQNELLKEIDANVSKIDSHEEVNYRLKGFGKVFKNTLKFFGLLMVSPLKGIIPSIATETIITGNMIKNLYKNLEWEEEKKMVYEAMDYSSMINNAISDLESTGRIVDMTLDDIVRLKMKYNEKFKQYRGDFTEYQFVMQKINDMENKILGNKIKIELMKKKALDQKRENEKKLRLVRELNN